MITKSSNLRSPRIMSRIRRPLGYIGITGCAVCAGCIMQDGSTLPAFDETAEVALSDTDTDEAELGSGVAELADSVWAVYKTEDDSLMFRIRYGSEGQFAEVFDNAVLGQPWQGDTIILDTEQHDTAFAGGTYLAGSYMAAEGDAVGIYAVYYGIYLGAHVGTASFNFHTTLDGDRVEGIFVRRVSILGVTPFDSPGDADIDVYVEREE